MYGTLRIVSSSAPLAEGATKSNMDLPKTSAELRVREKVRKHMGVWVGSRSRARATPPSLCHPVSLSLSLSHTHTPDASQLLQRAIPLDNTSTLVDTEEGEEAPCGVLVEADRLLEPPIRGRDLRERRLEQRHDAAAAGAGGEGAARRAVGAEGVVEGGEVGGEQVRVNPPRLRQLRHQQRVQRRRTRRRARSRARHYVDCLGKKKKYTGSQETTGV